MTFMQRRAITISGIVQGVGFRPFVYSLASRLKLQGFVQNNSGVVLIEVQGAEPALNRFIDQLQSQSPPLSRIERLSWQPVPMTDDDRFRIAKSHADSLVQTFVSPDLATCEDCRGDLFDPTNRRFRYPFLNCTQCGPRLTIIHRAPYDRANTTMADFAMCDLCRAEYDDPAQRRFHAEPIACANCGPRLQLLDQTGQTLAVDDPLRTFSQDIRAGSIGALKGIGGYHLVCSATKEETIQRLRRRKHRDEKPFAVMLGNADLVAKCCHIDSAQRDVLTSARRPIVLLRRRTDGLQVSDAVAPHNALLGVMLPYSPLHELLMEACGDQPLVMTSGNQSDEPIAVDDGDAVARLGGIADLFLIHDRQIRVRCDDSVSQVIAGQETPLRRSRGYAPIPIVLPSECGKPMLAVGGQLKNVFALARGRHAFLSHHIGDLDHLAAVSAFQHDIELYEELFDIKPHCVVHDLHPDYASTTYALKLSDKLGIQAVGVQHHHAHLASCMVENQLDGDVIGVIFDGSGYAADGTIWGGEFLVGGYESTLNAARLRRVRLPGSDKAAREPWRMALSYLIDAECDIDDWSTSVTGAQELVGNDAGQVVRKLIDTGFNSPWTSSAGRLFDAIAALTGVRWTTSFEGQAAMQLESLALNVTADTTYPYAVSARTEPRGGWELDPRPIIRGVVSDVQMQVDPAVISARFHHTVAAMIVDTCSQIAAAGNLNRVVLSGGVFMNSLLSQQTEEQLTANGFDVYRHHVVPPNDGGLCLGQLAVAARRMP